MGHGYRPVISKIRVENPNERATKIRNYNLLHYIATREGVDLTRIDNTIEAMVNENLDLNEKGEDIVFQDAENKEYLKYIAYRPRSHGLFGNIDTERFENVSKLVNQVSDDNKCIYRGIVSLSELDAQALGYNNINKWNLYLNSIMPDIAEKLGLSPNNITWVAAFHAEQKHPHVHYMLWDNRDIVKSPYIHTSTQEACRKICQDAMFTDENEAIIRAITAAERKEYYGHQNTSRQEITSYIQKIFEDSDCIPGINNEKLPGQINAETHKELNELYKKVLSTMPGQGRITYKYMPVECKAYIDRISEIFLKQPDIRQEYYGYVKAVNSIHKSLGKTKQEIERAKEYAIKELQSRTGNIVLTGIWNLRNNILNDQSFEKEETDKLKEEFPDGTIETGHDELYLDVSGEDSCIQIDHFEAEQELLVNEEKEQSDKLAEESNPEENKIERIERDKYSRNGDIRDNNIAPDFFKSMQALMNKKSEKYNPVEAEQKLLEKLEDNVPVLKKYKKYICKKLGALYSDSNSILQDYDKATYYLEDCIPVKKWDSDIHMLLGKIYGDEDYQRCDLKKSEEHYLEALKDESKNYLKLKLSRMYANSKSELCDYDKALDILQGYSDDVGSVSLQKGNIYSDVDSPFYNMEEAIAFYEMAAQKNNVYGAYNLGKIFINKESDFYDLKKGIGYLEKAAKGNVLPAHVSLGRIYMDKKRGYYSTFKAHEHLTIAKNHLEEIEKKKFSKLSKRELETKAQICMYLGKIYSEQNVLHNYNKALIQFEDCIKTYEKAGDINNIILNNVYVKMAHIFADKEEKYYNPAVAEKYLIKAFNNSVELQNQQEQIIENRQTIQYIILQLNKLYIDEDSPLWDLNKAMAILQDQEDDIGIFSLKKGNIYANEKYEGYNMQKAVECYKDAAAKENTTAMVKLAKCYLFGMGVDKDKQEAMYWLNRAADAGDEYAKEYMKKMDSLKFNNYSYTILRQIFSSMKQTKDKGMMKMQETEFKVKSKQAKKEEYLHHN